MKALLEIKRVQTLNPATLRGCIIIALLPPLLCAIAKSLAAEAYSELPPSAKRAIASRSNRYMYHSDKWRAPALS